MLVINIYNLKFGDMFQLIKPSSGQIQNLVLVHSVSAHYRIPYCLQNCIDIKDNLLADVFRSSRMFCVTRVLRCWQDALPQELPSSDLRSSGILSRVSGGLSVLVSVSTSKPGCRRLFTGVLYHQSEH
jgi:hypothetical protein